MRSAGFSGLIEGTGCGGIPRYIDRKNSNSGNRSANPKALIAARCIVLAITALTNTLHAAAQQPDSLTLVEALANARARSPVLVGAVASIRAAEARETVARSAGQPDVALSGTYLRFQDPPSMALGPGQSFSPFVTNGYLLQLGITQPVYTGGRISRSVRAAELATNAAEAQRTTVEVELTAAVAHAHDDALLARALRQVVETGTNVLRDAVRVAVEHYDAGTVSRLDVLRAETRLAASEARLREARDTETAALERLAAVIGVDPSDAHPVAGTLALDSSATHAAAVRLLSGLDEEPPGVEALRRIADAYQAQAHAAAASRNPSVTLFASALATRPEFVTGRERWSSEWLAGLFVTWPFLDSGASGGEARAATAAAGHAMAKADEAMLSARVQARSQYRALQRAALDASTGSENVARAERALEIARERYADGIGIQLEVLEAEADLTAARSDVLRAVHSHRSALLELRRVAGLAADAPLPAVPEGGYR